MNNDVIVLENGNWIKTDQLKVYEDFYKHQQKLFAIFMRHPEAMELHNQRSKAKEDNRKWAWIKVGNTRKLCWVDNKTMKAYKTDGYSPTWIEIPKFTFERWATTFDL